MEFGLFIIGDEILTGSRCDKHFSFFKKLLTDKGLTLAWVQYLPDDERIITRQLQRSFQDGGAVFVTGGIGATPDDYTRQACANALHLPLVRHEEALRHIEAVTLKHGESLSSDQHLQRAHMADFVQGAQLIPNPFNGIAGFFIREHYFFPGFPQMAHPMAAWVLDHYYASSSLKEHRASTSALIDGLPESALTPLMQEIERRWTGIKTFSLPTIREDLAHDEQLFNFRVEFGIKASGQAIKWLPEAWSFALTSVHTLGATKITPCEESSES